MPRVTKSNIAKKKHKKILSSTKGHYGARSRLFKTAKQSHIKALQYAFRDRKIKKRTFRSLWITRISSALQEYEISYSKFINNLKKSIYNNLAVKNKSKDLYKNEKKINANIINLKSTKEDKKLTLVEEIEEFGFIPSIDKKNNSNAA